MRFYKLFLPFMLIGLFISPNLILAQTASPTPYSTTNTTYDGRPPDAYTSPTPTSTTTETCSCVSSDGMPHSCTVYRPPETRTCQEVCLEEAESASSATSSPAL